MFWTNKLKNIGFKMLRDYQNWTTNDEQLFICSLGARKMLNVNRAEMLMRYITASKKRVNWGSIKKQDCIKFAKRELHRELNK